MANNQKKKLNLISNQANANQNLSEMTSNIYQNYKYFKYLVIPDTDKDREQLSVHTFFL